MIVESRSRVAVVIVLCVHLVGTAHADDPQPAPTSQTDPGVYVFLGALAVNTGFTIYDLATIGRAKPKVYGFGEALLTVPQTLLFGSLAAMADDSDAWIPASLAIWTGALAAHGIYTLARAEPSSADSSPRVVMLSFGAAF